MAVHAHFFENRYLGSLIEHSREKLSELKELAEKEPRYKEAVTIALQALSHSLHRNDLTQLSFHNSKIDGSTKRHVEELKRCYLGISKDAPFPKQICDDIEPDGTKTYKDIPKTDLATMKALLLENAQEQVKSALEELSRERSPEDSSPRAKRLCVREAQAHKQAERAKFLQQAELVRARQKERAAALSNMRANGLLLRLQAPIWRADKEIVCVAFEENPYSLKFADSTLLADASFILHLIDKRPESIQYIITLLPATLWSDKDFLIKMLEMLFCTEDPFPLARSNRRFSLCCTILNEAQDSIRTDPDFFIQLCTICPKNIPSLFSYADASLTSNTDFLLRIVEAVHAADDTYAMHSLFLTFIIGCASRSTDAPEGPVEQVNTNFLLALIRLYPTATNTILTCYTNHASDTQFVLSLIEQLPEELDSILDYAEPLCSNREFLLAAFHLIENGPSLWTKLLAHISPSLKADKTFKTTLITRYPRHRILISVFFVAL